MISQAASRSRQAAKRIAKQIERTPLQHSVAFSDKLGATNRLLTLSDEQRAQGCVAASSGNHGAAVACATQKLGVKGVIFVPEQTSSAKVDKIKSYGGDVRFFGTDGLDTWPGREAVAWRLSKISRMWMPCSWQLVAAGLLAVLEQC